ncbi:MAG: hypothetical protein COT74_03995 [Bdellovibrionales bacterium CG10_big_fil_rev_8_21_14_0_10_45_34]|nr:MAG: hypothetical protein COT74_03995 [Bdellovibrionales bacterium CG10_big_fil_rev_8_21_14_0_10_45_34]
MIKNLLLVSSLFLISNHLGARPKSNSFAEALRTVLTDNATIEEIDRALGTMTARNSKRYDLSPILDKFQSVRRVVGGDFFRVLSLVDAVSNTNIEEAVEILLERVEQRSVDDEDFEQFTQHDILAIDKIAAKLDPQLQLTYRRKANLVLLKKYNESPGNEDLALTVVVNIESIKLPEASTVEFLFSLMKSGNSKIREWATRSLPSYDNIELIRLAWREIEQLPHEFRQDSKMALIEGIGWSRDEPASRLSEFEDFLASVKENDPSPEVRGEAKKQHYVITFDDRIAKEFARLSPEDRKIYLERLGKVLEFLNGGDDDAIEGGAKACDGLFGGENPNH